MRSPALSKSKRLSWSQKVEFVCKIPCSKSAFLEFFCNVQISKSVSWKSASASTDVCIRPRAKEFAFNFTWQRIQIKQLETSAICVEFASKALKLNLSVEGKSVECYVSLQAHQQMFAFNPELRNSIAPQCEFRSPTNIAFRDWCNYCCILESRELALKIILQFNNSCLNFYQLNISFGACSVCLSVVFLFDWLLVVWYTDKEQLMRLICTKSKLMHFRVSRFWLLNKCHSGNYEPLIHRVINAT